MLKRFVLASCLFGCAWEPNPHHVYELSIDLSTLYPNQADVIVEAAHEWSVATNGFIKFEVSSTYQPVNLSNPVINITGKSTAELAKSDQVGVCWYHGEQSDIFIINDSFDFSYLHYVALHELGHAIGAVHIDAGNIMYYMVESNPTTIQCGDVQDVCKAWNDWRCDPSSSPACLPPTPEAGPFIPIFGDQ